MKTTTTDEWTTWQRQIYDHLQGQGVLPTLTTEGLEIPFDVVSECWLAADTSPTDLPSVCRLTGAAGDVAERAAVVLFLTYLSDAEPYLRLPEPEETERRTVIRKLFSDAVSLLPVDQIDSAWRIRWELLFSATAELFDRTRALVQHWVVLAPSEEHDALTSLARISFFSVHPARSKDWASDWWSPYEGSRYSQVGDLFALHLATQLDNRVKLDSAPWSLPRTMPTDQFSRVLDAENAIAKLRDAGNGSIEVRFIGAWCSAVIAVRLENVDRTRDAARQYARLARDPNLPKLSFDSDNVKARRLPAWSAAMLFRDVGDLDSARDMAIFWTQVDPESPDGWKFRAEIERDIGIDEWADSYEHYIRLAPETDASWEHSELLRLLLESRDQTTADRALRALALEHSDRSVVEEMLTWDWPTYTQLHESTRERWWDGLLFVCDARVRAAFRRAPWRYAAACFGEAVALELRARVFGPFAATTRIDRHTLSDREGRIAYALLSAKATLGTMVEALTLSTDVRSELGTLINRFLGQKHRPLRAYFQSKPAVERLKAATESRNEAVHDDITPEGAKQVYAEARGFLTMLVRANPRAPER